MQVFVSQTEMARKYRMKLSEDQSLPEMGIEHKNNIYYCHDNSVSDPVGREKDATGMGVSEEKQYPL